jgi:hypothetical protein
MPDPDPGFPLPLIVDPPRICIQIEIPNERYHIAAFLGNFVNLGYWFNWQRDDAHTGLAVSKIWYDIFLQVAKQISLGGNCPPDFGFPGADDGSDFMIRQNTDNPCLLESSVNGTDWCPWADLSKCTNFGTQPGTGVPQPAPGGGVQQTCKKMDAKSPLLIPTVVSTGDTITLTLANGATNDPDDPSASYVWRLENGNHFFAGADFGNPVNVITDPLPTANHMSIVAAIGTPPTFIGLPLNTPVTVPGGIDNAQLSIQVNDSNLTNDNGSLDVCVDVKNNQTDLVGISYTHGTGPSTAHYGDVISMSSVSTGGDNRIDVSFTKRVRLSILSQTGYVNTGTPGPTNVWAGWQLGGVTAGTLVDPPDTVPTDFPASTPLDALGMDTGGPSSNWTMVCRIDAP